MDKQTAIDLLDNLLGMVEDNHDSDYDTAIHMGIDALKSNAPNALSALDCVDRRAVIDGILEFMPPKLKDDATSAEHVNYSAWCCALNCAESFVRTMPSVQPERMTNRQWVDFLSAQFDISRTSAKEMLHGMMRWKKEDNFKKMFNGGKT